MWMVKCQTLGGVRARSSLNVFRHEVGLVQNSLNACYCAMLYVTHTLPEVCVRAGREVTWGK